MTSITAAAVQRHVAEAFGISMIEMHNRSRVYRFGRPRAVAMYLARELTDLTFPELGLRFANRDHSTIIKNINRVKTRMACVPEFAAQVASIRDSLEHPII